MGPFYSAEVPLNVKPSVKDNPVSESRFDIYCACVPKNNRESIDLTNTYMSHLRHICPLTFAYYFLFVFPLFLLYLFDVELSLHGKACAGIAPNESVHAQIRLNILTRAIRDDLQDFYFERKTKLKLISKYSKFSSVLFLLMV